LERTNIVIDACFILIRILLLLRNQFLDCGHYSRGVIATLVIIANYSTRLTVPDNLWFLRAVLFCLPKTRAQPPASSQVRIEHILVHHTPLGLVKRRRLGSRQFIQRKQKVLKPTCSMEWWREVRIQFRHHLRVPNL
jgi:hypothetical protein